MAATAPTVGSCNTRLSDKSVAPFRPTEAGIDTWRLAYYLDRDSDLRRVREVTTRPGPGCWLAPDQLLGHTLGFVPSSDLLFVEGHPDASGLGLPDGLPEIECALLRALRESTGISAPRPAGVGRLDATVTTAFADARHGRAVLSGIAALDHPRQDVTVWGHPPQTVYLRARNGKRALGRAYDKGRESGSAPPGELIRLEDQRRWPKSSRRDVVELSASYVREKFQGRFASLWQASKGVKMASIPVLTSEVAQRLQAGEMTQLQAEKLLGFLVLQANGIAPTNARSGQRRRRLLREHGLVVADDFYDSVDVDLAPILEAALATDAWERRG